MTAIGKMDESEFDPREESPVLEIIGVSGNTKLDHCSVVGARNINIHGQVHQKTRIVGIENGEHTRSCIIGLENASIGKSTKGDDDLKSGRTNPYFGGKDTGVLLVAGRPKQCDGTVFMDDIDAMAQGLKHLGILENMMYTVTPNDRGNQERNINRAVEDLRDAKIKKFIFFFSGHCNEDGEFLIAGRREKEFWYPHEDLKSCLQNLPARKMLLILDTCYSGGLDMGARGARGQGRTRADKGQPHRSETRAVAVMEEDLPSYHEPTVPCLWDLFEGAGKSGSSLAADGTQVVQWCSSSSGERSYTLHGGGIFTNAILRYIDKMEEGSSASVLDIHKHVKNNQVRQNAVLKPDQAAKQSSGYMRKYPSFRKRQDKG